MSAQSELRRQQLIRYGEALAEAAAAFMMAAVAKDAGDSDAAKIAEDAAATSAAKADAIFAEFACGIYPRLRCWAARILKDEHLSEDASQRALYKIFCALQNGQWDSERGAVCWAKTIVQNEAKDMCKQRDNQQGLLHKCAQHQKALSGEESSLELTLPKEFPVKLRKWLRRHLTREERRLLYYRFCKRLTFKEIGKKMGYALAHVYRKLGHLLAKLRKLMDAEQGLAEGVNHA